jgi:hypothetical protein
MALPHIGVTFHKRLPALDVVLRSADAIDLFTNGDDAAYHGGGRGANPFPLGDCSEKGALIDETQPKSCAQRSDKW